MYASARNVEIIIGISRRRREMKIKCESCSKWFEAARMDAKYCSSTCRSKKSRLIATDNPFATDNSVATDNPELSVATDKIGEEDATDKLSVALALKTPEELIESGKIIAKKKKEAMLATDLPEVSLDTPCNTGLSPETLGEIFLDVEKDLGLSLKKDLGCYSWTRDGIMIRPDITVQQVHNIAKLIHAKHGRPCPPFREATSV
jgi:hypothetical protein